MKWHRASLLICTLMAMLATGGCAWHFHPENYEIGPGVVETKMADGAKLVSTRRLLKGWDVPAELQKYLFTVDGHIHPGYAVICFYDLTIQEAGKNSATPIGTLANPYYPLSWGALQIYDAARCGDGYVVAYQRDLNTCVAFFQNGKLAEAISIARGDSALNRVVEVKFDPPANAERGKMVMNVKYMRPTEYEFEYQNVVYAIDAAEKLEATVLSGRLSRWLSEIHNIELGPPCGLERRLGSE